MPINKTCECCHKAYSVTPARAEKTRFCSRACRSASDRTAERRNLTCETCCDTFSAVADHGVWPRFCSRSCFLSQCVRPKEKQCSTCGELFTARSSHHDSADGLQEFCSKKCHIESMRRGGEYQCLNCGAAFLLTPSKIGRLSNPGCCSNACRKDFYTGARSPGFKGGHTKTQTGEKHLLLRRPGYAGRYVGEHRVVASREIGRLVTRQEFVIRLNRNPEDNRPENLFICESNSEFSRRRNGSLPWPTKSNLQDFAARPLLGGAT